MSEQCLPGPGSSRYAFRHQLRRHGGPPVLLGDDQLLHLALCQLSLSGHQSGLRVPQPGLPAIRVELTGQDLGTGILQSFPLPLEVSLMTVEASLTGAQDLELMAEGHVIQLLPLLQLALSLLQLPLQLLHLPHPLVDLACVHNKVLLLLDDNAGPGLS
jgi:hypothetical protein